MVKKLDAIKMYEIAEPGNTVSVAPLFDVVCMLGWCSWCRRIAAW